MTTEIELLSCPFCGAEADFEYDDWNSDTEKGDDGGGWCRCQNPACGVGFHDNYESAVAQWNRRHCIGTKVNE